MHKKLLDTVSIHYLIGIYNAACRHDLNGFDVLSAANIQVEMLNKTDIRISPEQLSLAFRCLMRMADDEFLTMCVHPSRFGSFNLMAKYAVTLSNLRDVYHHIAEFYNLTNGGIQLSLIEKNNTASFSMELLDSALDPDFILREFLLLIWHRFPAWLASRFFKLESVDLNYQKPLHWQELPALFPCRINYQSDSCKITFDARHLDLKVVQTPASLSQYLRRVPYDWFKRQQYQAVYTRKVIDYLQRCKQLEFSSIEALAEQLHMADRTLRRKLSEESTSFQKIKDDYRRDRAMMELSQAEKSINKIAEELGFAEPSAFSRAFKKWTGLTPIRYKQSY